MIAQITLLYLLLVTVIANFYRGDMSKRRFLIIMIVILIIATVVLLRSIDVFSMRLTDVLPHR